MIYAVAYRSRAIHSFTQQELDELEADAAEYNRLRNVTGILLFDGLNFFQYFEGPKVEVDDVFLRIRNSMRHRIQQVVFDGLAQDRHFDGWHLAARRTSPGAISRLSTVLWRMPTTAIIASTDDSEGLLELIAFWRRAGLDSPG